MKKATETVFTFSDPSEVITPTIHLNGTSGEELLKGYNKAALALGEALIALQDAFPHPRDYYPQHRDTDATGALPGAFQQAAQEMRLRIECVRKVRDEIHQIRNTIEETLFEREVQKVQVATYQPTCPHCDHAPHQGKPCEAQVCGVKVCSCGVPGRYEGWCSICHEVVGVLAGVVVKHPREGDGHECLGSGLPPKDKRWN